jgi:hypothetical protein
LGIGKACDFFEFGSEVGSFGNSLRWALRRSNSSMAAVETLGLGGVGEETFPGIRTADEAFEDHGETESVILVYGDLNAVGHGVGKEVGVEAQGLIQGGGGESGFDGGTSIEGLPGEGDAFDGDRFLVLYGLAGGDSFGVEDGELVEIFEADGAEFGGGVPVLAGVLRGAGLALAGARFSGASGIRAVGGQAPFGDGCVFLHTRVE